MNNLFVPNSKHSGSVFGLISGLIRNPGDSLSARVTPNNRQVIKLNTSTIKYSATRYPTGTIVETRTIRPK